MTKNVGLPDILMFVQQCTNLMYKHKKKTRCKNLRKKHDVQT